MRKGLIPICLLVAAAMAASGCSDSTSSSDPAINARIQTDAAYEAVAAAQIANAVAYSEAIAKSTGDADVKSFASSVLAERRSQQDLLDRMRRTGEKVDVAKASHTLNISLDDLAISASGKPLTAPSSDAGYLKAMKSNLEASAKAAQAQLANGGPGTAQLANRVIAAAQSELDQLKQLQQ